MTIRVQHGRLAGIGGMTNQVTLDHEIDTERAFLIIQTRSSDTSNVGADHFMVRGIIQSSTTLNFQCLEDVVDSGEVTWWLVEALDKEFIVEEVTGSFHNTNETVSLSGTYDLDRTMVVVSSRADGSGFWDALAHTVFVAAWMSSTTELQLRHLVGTTDADVAYAAYVVEWSEDIGVTVEDAQVVEGFDGVTEEFHDFDTPGIDDLTSWLYTSFKHDESGLEKVSVELRLDFDNNRVGFVRFDTTSVYDTTMAFNLLRFPSNSGIRCAQGSGLIDTNDTTKEITLNRKVHAASSVPFLSNSMDGDGQAYPRHALTAEFSSIDVAGWTDKITVDRDRDLQEGNVWVNVMDFSDFNRVEEGAALAHFP